MLEQSCHRHLSQRPYSRLFSDTIPGKYNALLPIFISQNCSAVFKKKIQKEVAYLHLITEVGRCK